MNDRFLTASASIYPSGDIILKIIKFSLYTDYVTDRYFVIYLDAWSVTIDF